ncbi:MAG TPA: CotH kinase family protein [Flavobacteriales bacterium]|nr:CotH kinase family protein [Flavobacteriales bacterium]
MKKTLVALFALTSSYANSQILINEYSGANLSQHIDNFGNFEDWFELYNTTTGPIDISGWYLSDSYTNNDKFLVPSGVIIAANSYLRVYCSNKNQFVAGVLHTNFKLTQTKPEKIVLSNPAGTIIDFVTMNPTQPNHSRGRTTDGAATWSLFDNPTAGNNNSLATAYAGYTTKPIFSQLPGAYTTSMSIALSSDPGAEIYYTTNGTTPTAASTLYTGPISISSTKVIRAVAIHPTDATRKPSFVETNTYLINENHTIPVTSVSGDAIMTLLTGTQIDADMTLEWFDKDQVFKTEVTGTSNEHGNDSWAYGQRGFDYISIDEYGINYALTDKIFARKDRDAFQRVIFKPAANDNFSFESGGAHIRDAYVATLSHDADLNLDERTYEPTILYVNGQYWGVYEIREKVDDDEFCDYYYDQDQPYILFLKTWGATWEEYSPVPGFAQNDWDNLKAFVGANSLTIPANYDYVDSLLNTKSLTDYFILNSYTACADWLNWNTAWWRGLDSTGDKKKWRYTLWDMDATFGHYVNYTGIPDQGPGADPCAPEALPDPGGQGHVTILDSLLKNPKFHTDYINRYIDLNNNALSCANMVNLLDSLIGNILPEMPRQIAKWGGGSFATWQTNVNTLRNYIIARCDSITEGLMDCYSLTGPYSITFETDPPDVGTIKVNTMTYSPAQLPKTGTYYGNIVSELEAESIDPDYEFKNWEIIDIPTPTADSAKISTTFNVSQTVIAHFEIPLTLFVPTAFSPNGDGINDFFTVLGKGMKAMEMSVYDRWGEKVWGSSDKDIPGWDGTYKGKKCDQAVYAYQVKVTYLDGSEKIQKGNVTLVR